LNLSGWFASSSIGKMFFLKDESVKSDENGFIAFSIAKILPSMQISEI